MQILGLIKQRYVIRFDRFIGASDTLSIIAPSLADEINEFEIPISSKPYADLIDSSNREAI